MGHGYGTREVKGHGWLGTFREEVSANFLTLREYATQSGLTLMRYYINIVSKNFWSGTYTGGKEVIVSMHKEDVLEWARQLPDEIDVEEVIYRLYLREKLAAAEADIAAGRTLSPEEVRKQARTWRQ